MTTSQFFASSYTVARAKFLAASRDSGARVTHYTLPELRGPEKEELVMDVAQLGETDPGTHGIEGFCGSGCHQLERRATTKNNENHSVCDRFPIAYFLLERPYPDWVSS